jgi:hypothetical protein
MTAACSYQVPVLILEADQRLRIPPSSTTSHIEYPMLSLFSSHDDEPSHLAFYHHPLTRILSPLNHRRGVETRTSSDTLLLTALLQRQLPVNDDEH